MLGTLESFAQTPGDISPPRTRNVEVVGRLEWGAAGTSKVQARPELVMEQASGRPFLYAVVDGRIAVIDLSDPKAPREMKSLDIRSDRAYGVVVDLDLTKLDDRYYLIVAVDSHPDGAPEIVVFDVTEVAAQSVPVVASYGSLQEPLSGIFAYKHSSGSALLFAAAGKDVVGLDIAMLLDGHDPLFGRYPTPSLIDTTFSGFRDVYAAFEPLSQQDRLYGAGAGGYYIYDVTDVELPAVRARVSAAAVRIGTRIAATPNGRYLVTAAGYRTSPIYIFDMEPALEDVHPAVRTAVGAWTADWRNRSRAFEVRWPYVFVAALHDGFHMFNMRDASEPYTVGFVRTWSGSLPKMAERDREEEGAWDIDVRNSDGLIAVSDTHSGIWLLRIESFEGWLGSGWGVPNTSTVQDWDNGPDGASMTGFAE